MEATIDRSSVEAVLGVGRSVILWSLFFFISFGLGYQTLNRYDESKLDSDVAIYSKMVLHQASPNDTPLSFRMLVPEVARPFYLLANERIGTWNPVSFGLLMSNSLFCATAAFLFLLIGLHVSNDLPVALLGVTLYLLNFVVSNVFLSGLVDTSEACLILAVAWALFSGRWGLLPLIGILGGFAKESFLPFSMSFALTWWLASKRSDRNYRQIGWVLAAGATSWASIALAHRIVAGNMISPWSMLSWWGCEGACAVQLLREFTDQEFWFVFVWLLPLGIWRLDRFPRPWVFASITTALLALALGAYAGSLGSVCRQVFSIAGPVLSLSVANFLTGRPTTESRKAR